MNTLKTRIFIYTVAELLKFCQTTVIMIPPDIETRFIKAKNPNVYNINEEDPFDKLTIDEIIDICDLVIDSPSYMWHNERIDLRKFAVQPIKENYQRKYNLKPNKELNIPELIGINIKNHESIPFKRIYCCEYVMGNYRNEDKFHLEIYFSYGEELNYPFLLTRFGKNAPLEVVGIIDKNELTWKDIEMNVNLSDLVKSLSSTQSSVCSFKDQGINFEICSRVHNHIFSNEESVEEYGLNDDNSIEQNEFDSYKVSNNNVAHSEYIYDEGTDPDKIIYSKTPSSTNDDYFRKLNATIVSEKKFTSAAEELFTATLENEITDNTYFKEKVIDEDAAKGVIRDASIEVKGSDKKIEKEVIKEVSFKDRCIHKNAEKEVIGNGSFEGKYIDKNIKEKVVADATFKINSIIDGSSQNESDTYECCDYDEPNVFDWSDQGERACNTRYVSVDNQKPDTLPVESLRCMFYVNGMRTNKFFVALINREENKLSLAVMRPKNFVYNKKTSPLEVRATVDFIRH